MRWVAVDGTSCIYQFVLKSRMRAETAVRRGFFYRTIGLLERGFAPFYCFDGIAHPLKNRDPPKVNYIDTALEVLTVMGIPCVRAPHDGEAQCAGMSDLVEFTTTMDIDDAFAFGANQCGGDDLRPKKRMVTLLTGKVPRITVFDLSRWLVFQNLPEEWDREKYVEYRILQGTDFNPKLLPRYTGKLRAIKLLNNGKGEETEYWNERAVEVKELFMNPPVVDVRRQDVRLATPDLGELFKYFTVTHHFNKAHIKAGASRLLHGASHARGVRTLQEWVQ